MTEALYGPVAAGCHVRDAGDYQYMPRNSTDGAIYDLPWDGTTTHGNGPNQVQTVPSGQYVIRATVVKALGNPNVAEDVETWISPTITIARPTGPWRPMRGRAQHFLTQ